MKNLISLTILLAMSAGHVLAATGIEQQIAVTRDAINNLSNSMQHGSSRRSLHMTDYRAWELDYKAKMERHFEIFESEMALKVYGPLQDSLERMKAIQEDKYLGADQKLSLILALRSSLNGMVPVIESEYKKILLKLYYSNNHFAKNLVSLGPVETTHYGSKNKIVSARRKWYQRTQTMAMSAQYADGSRSGASFNLLLEHIQVYTNTTVTNRTYNVSTDAKGQLLVERLMWFSPYTYNMRYYELPWSPFGWNEAKVARAEPVHVFSDLRLPYEVTHERIMRGCKSKACLITKSNEIIFWYQSIRNLIDRNIDIVIPGGLSITINGLNYGNTVSEITRLLGRQDFPASVEQWPFDL